MTAEWEVLVPVKHLRDAKTRIDIHPLARADLALAMCHDVLAAVSKSSLVSGVRVVTADHRVTAAARSMGASAWSAPGHVGLNAELAAAMKSVCAARGVAIVMADLPCLTSDVFDDILGAAPLNRPSYVTDVIARGTTMLLNPPSFARTAPRFGACSALSHAATAVQLRPANAWIRARHDVDTLDGLRGAVRLGLGPSTRALVERGPECRSLQCTASSHG